MDWIGGKLNHALSYPSHAIALSFCDKIIAAFLFTCATPHDIEVSAVIEPKSRVPRRFYKFLSDYCFTQLNLARITATTSQETVATRLERFGFIREGFKMHVYGVDKHGIVLGLYKGKGLV